MTIKTFFVALTISSLLIVSTPAYSQWGLGVSVSALKSNDLSAEFNAAGSSAVNISADSGFGAGLLLSYAQSDAWKWELEWQYQTRDSTTVGIPEALSTEGNYASNLFSFGGSYAFGDDDGWQPYVGAGLVWLQEVDLDIESPKQELSYAANGDIGWLLKGGVQRAIANDWLLQFEASKVSVTGIDLDAEQGTGVINSLDYEPLAISFKLLKQF